MIAGGGTYQGEPRIEARHSRVKGCFHFISIMIVMMIMVMILIMIMLMMMAMAMSLGLRRDIPVSKVVFISFVYAAVAGIIIIYHQPETWGLNFLEALCPLGLKFWLHTQCMHVYMHRWCLY